MKIIDERGRLLGKINVIDFLVILFLLCLTPMFYFGYKLYLAPKKSAADVEKETKIESLADIEKRNNLIQAEEKSETEDNQILIRQISGLTSQINDLTRQISDIVNRINGLEEKVNVISSIINQSTSKKKTRK